MLSREKNANKIIEKRRFTRVKLALIGRYMIEDRREFPCQTIDVSVGGLALTAPVRGAVGERIVGYFETLGRIEGHVVRHLDHGFAMTALLSPAKREKMVNTLIWRINYQELGFAEDRRGERIALEKTETLIRLPDGAKYSAHILDLSVTGVAVASDARPPIGSMLHVGSRPARVMRHFDEGLALEFALPVSYDVFDRNLVL
jgi:hypothetical protein